MRRKKTVGFPDKTEKVGHKKVYISPYWGEDPLYPILTKMVLFTHIPEVINHYKFGVDRLTRLVAMRS